MLPLALDQPATAPGRTTCTELYCAALYRTRMHAGMVLYASSLCIRQGASYQAGFEVIRQLWIITIQFFECLNVATQALCATYLGKQEVRRRAGLAHGMHCTVHRILQCASCRIHGPCSPHSFILPSVCGTLACIRVCVCRCHCPQIDHARSVLARLSVMGMVVGAAAGAGVWLARDGLVHIFTRDPAVVAQVLAGRARVLAAPRILAACCPLWQACAHTKLASSR